MKGDTLIIRYGEKKPTEVLHRLVSNGKPTNVYVAGDKEGIPLIALLRASFGVR